MAFDGFGRQTLRFLSELRKHNSKAWFDEHRDEYESAFLGPAKAFVAAMGPKLQKLDRDIHAEPRVNGSILRINRDIRFSKDKSPYKDHMDLWFWAGEDKKGWECSGFFFRLTAREMLLGAGIHVFSPALLARYRQAVLDEASGKELVKIVSKLRKAGYDVGNPTYKRTPSGVAADHPRAELLKHGGITAGWHGPHPRELGSAALVTFCAKHCAAWSALHAWARQLT